MNKIIVRMFLMLISWVVLSAFSCGGSSSSTGFKVHIEELISDEFGNTPLGGADGVGVTATWEGDLPGRTIAGSRTSFSGITDGNGNVSVDNARLPATWGISWIDQNRCENTGVDDDRNQLEEGDTVAYFCITFTGDFFSSSPSVVDETSLPMMTLISPSANIDTRYGIPLVDFRDVGGNLLGTATASWISSDHTQLGVSPWPLGGVYDGSYAALTRVYDSDGTTRYVGASRFQTSGNPIPDPPPPPPDSGCGGTGGIANTCN